jgi:hypothetical protein
MTTRCRQRIDKLDPRIAPSSKQNKIDPRMDMLFALISLLTPGSPGNPAATQTSIEIADQ